MIFEWDEAKRQSTLDKHGLDFVDAVEVLAAPHLLLQARSDIEERQIAIGMIGEIHVAVIFTMRDETCRIITARRARRDERERYKTLLPG